MRWMTAEANFIRIQLALLASYRNYGFFHSSGANFKTSTFHMFCSLLFIDIMIPLSFHND